MPVQGTPRNYDQRFLFSIEIDGLAVAWFTTAGPLEAELGIVEHREGGSINVADQAPGLAKYTPITLTIGATDNSELWEWWEQVYDAAADAGLPTDAYKKNLAIVQRDRDKSEKKRWNLYRAWPHKFKAGEWDANAEENVIEEITLCYLRFGK